MEGMALYALSADATAIAPSIMKEVSAPQLKNFMPRSFQNFASGSARK